MATSDVELGAADNIGPIVQLLVDNEQKGRDVCNQPLPSIFMVPSSCRNLSERSYNPRVVSIGPLHSQDKNLQGFEVQKMKYLHRLLNLSGSNPKETLEKCVQKVSGKIEQIKACYEDVTPYKDPDLARMMVIDGCFILYFVHLLSLDNAEPYPGSRLIASTIVYDLLLIENQIPFFVLQDIFEYTILRFKISSSLTSHMVILFKWYNLFRESSTISLYTTPDHILGLLHKSLKPVQDIPSRYLLHTISRKHSAMELDMAGVNFRSNEDVNWAIAMKLELPRFSCFPWFCCKPTLRMPKLHVHDYTELILRNLIMYEQACLFTDYVTSYAWAMDMLIDTPEDVAKLIKSGVLVNDYGSNENAAGMINSICQDVAFKGFYYDQEWQKLDTYYNSSWPSAAAGLKRTYFNSPWNMIALFAAIVLFVLTLVQTIYQIKDADPIFVTKH